MEKVYAVVDIGKSFAPASTFDTYGDLVSIVVKNAFVLAGIISFVLLIFGGFGVIVNAGGDAKKLEQAKKTTTAAVTGLILVVTSVLIVQLLAVVTGAEVLKQILGVK